MILNSKWMMHISQDASARWAEETPLTYVQPKCHVPLICFALSVGSTCPWVCKQYGSSELLFSTVHAEYERCSGSQSVEVVFYQSVALPLYSIARTNELLATTT